MKKRFTEEQIIGVSDAATVCRDFFNRRLQVVIVLNWGAGQLHKQIRASPRNRGIMLHLQDPVVQDMSTENKKFGSEELSALREDARLFLKLDLLYLASAGATIAAMKVNRYELPLLLSDLGTWIISCCFFLVCFLDAASASKIHNEWLTAIIGGENKLPPDKLTWWSRKQTICHFMFVTTLIVSVMGYSRGMTDAREKMQARAGIQQYVNFFIARHERPPNSIEELRTYYPKMDYLFDKLGSEQIILVHPGGKKYKIIFAGKDKKLGTEDDDVASDEIDFSKVYEEITCQERETCKK